SISFSQSEAMARSAGPGNCLRRRKEVVSTLLCSCFGLHRFEDRTHEGEQCSREEPVPASNETTDLSPGCLMPPALAPLRSIEFLHFIETRMCKHASYRDRFHFHTTPTLRMGRSITLPRCKCRSNPGVCGHAGRVCAGRGAPSPPGRPEH